MDCFETRNHMTDSIDGTLAPGARHDFEAHLKSCDPCTKQANRLRELIQVMHGQARAAIPLELRDDPLSFKLPALPFDKNPKAIWRNLPVWVRLMIEGIAIACVVTLGIQIGPQIRSFYEHRMDQRLQTMIAAEDLSNEGAVPLSRGKADPESAHSDTEFASEETEEPSEEVVVDPNLRVGRGEIWRFNIKTDSPALIRTKIMKAFAEAGIPESTAGFGGIEAPGGIQFDLIAPQTAIPQLKAQLEKLAAPGTNSAPGDTPFSETFTWYKNRSKKPIPSGTSRVVIWLSQI